MSVRLRLTFSALLASVVLASCITEPRGLLFFTELSPIPDTTDVTVLQIAGRVIRIPNRLDMPYTIEVTGGLTAAMDSANSNTFGLFVIDVPLTPLQDNTLTMTASDTSDAVLAQATFTVTQVDPGQILRRGGGS